MGSKLNFIYGIQQDKKDIEQWLVLILKVDFFKENIAID